MDAPQDTDTLKMAPGQLPKASADSDDGTYTAPPPAPLGSQAQYEWPELPKGEPQPEHIPSGTIIPHQPSQAFQQATGFDPDSYDKFRGFLAHKESSSYQEPRMATGSSSTPFVQGRYQMGDEEIDTAARRMGIPTPTPEQFLAPGNESLQEHLFENYTLGNHEKLMRFPPYATADLPTRAAMLAQAHLGGTGAVTQGMDSPDKFGTHPSQYLHGMLAAFHGEQAMRPVPEPGPQVPGPRMAGNVGPFNDMWSAYEGAPKDKDNYRLLQDGNKFTWQMKPPAGDPPGPSGMPQNPFFSEENTNKTLNQAVINGPHSWTDIVPKIVGTTGQSFNGAIAQFLDLPPWIADQALNAISAGTGTKRLDFHFGTPVRDAMNRMGFDTETAPTAADDPNGWADTLGRGIGSGLGMALPFMVGGAAAGLPGVATAAPKTAEVAQKIGGIGPGGANLGREASIGVGGGVGQQEAHEFYKSQTGREGDVGDIATQVLGGSAWNAARIPLLMGAEKIAASAIGRAWSSAKEAITGSGAQALNAGLDKTAAQVLDAKTGEQVASGVLRHQFSSNLKQADEHVASLSVAPPGDSAMYLADKGNSARKAVEAFRDGSSQDEAALLGQVNTEMPRDLRGTKLMYQRMKADYEAQGPHAINDWPKELDRIFARDTAGAPEATGLLDASGTPIMKPGDAKTGGLKDIDTLGAGHTVRMDLNRLIEREISKDPINETRLGVLQRVRNSLASALTQGEEGVSPQEIDAYRMLNAFSKARSTLLESPELQAFLGSKTGDPTALERMLKQGPEGASAVQILTGAAQARYGADGLLSAAQDALRQKYANTVAPNGYVSLGAHNAFMNRFGAVLDHPTMTNLKDQLNAAAQSEGNLNATIGFGRPGGFKNTSGTLERRADLAETYLNSPMPTVLRHLENSTAGDIATRRVFQQLHEDPTGEAAKGFQHAVAGKILADPSYLKNNPGMMQAIERENPGFMQRAEKYTTPSSVAGVVKALSDWALSYMGAHISENVLSQHAGLGSSMVMAGRGAEAARQIGQKVKEQLTQITSANIVDPMADAAWGRLMGGSLQTPRQIAADKLLLHSYVPGFAIGNLPSNPTPNTGAPGSPATNDVQFWQQLGLPGPPK